METIVNYISMTMESVGPLKLVIYLIVLFIAQAIVEYLLGESKVIKANSVLRVVINIAKVIIDKVLVKFGK